MKLWRIIITISTATDLLIKTFLAFFIWESEKNLYPILFFGLIYFAIIPIASLISGVLNDRVDSKTPLLLSGWLQIGQLVLIILFGNNLTLELIALIAVLGGLAEGLKVVSVHTIDIAERDIYHKEDVNKFYATRTLVHRILELILPLSAAYLVSQSNGYIDLFKLGIGLIVVQSLLLAIFKSPTTQNNFEIKNIFSWPGTNKDKPALVKGVFFEGLSEGITLTILPIIVLIFVGSILNWGLLNTSLVLIGVLMSFIITNLVNDTNSKLVYGIGALIFAASSIFFLNTFNLSVIIGFMAAKTLMGVIKETSYQASIDRIMEKDQKQYRLNAEYKFLVELVSGIGRVIPILILLYLGLNVQDEVVIRTTLILVGILPLIALSFLGKTAIFIEKIYLEDSDDDIPPIDKVKQKLPNLTQKIG